MSITNKSSVHAILSSRDFQPSDTYLKKAKMKLLSAFKLFWLVIKITDGNIFTLNAGINLSSTFPDAISEFVDNTFSLFATSVNLISPEFSRNYKLADIKNDIVKQVSLHFPIMFRLISSPEALSDSIKTYRKKFSVIILANDFDDFMEIYPRISSKIFRLDGLYLIILTNGEIPEIHDMFRLLWKTQIYNVNVMFEAQNSSIFVKTFLPFATGNCNNTDPVLINEFINGKFANENLFHNKMHNLHNCHVNVSISNNTQPSVIVKRMSNGSYDIGGENIKLLNALAQTLNFKIAYTFIGEEGYFHPNGTAKGPLKAVLDGQAELSINNWWLKLNRLMFLDSTSSYLSEPVSFVIPSSRELTAFAKLVTPFEYSVWLMILFYFLVGFVVIFFVKRREKSIQNFVFGPVVHPYYNMVVAFVGGAQRVLPRTNFARFLLTMFLIYSLVIRTLYQGAFFELLRSNKHHKDLESIEEMIDKNYKFYTVPGMLDLFQASEAIRNK